MITPRTDTSPSTPTSTQACHHLSASSLIISRTALIVPLTLLIFTTLASLLALTALLYREHARQKAHKAATQWGRKSRVDARISIMRKRVDEEFTAKYSGCLVNVYENPEMGSDSPVELMMPERVWEVEGGDCRTREVERKGRVRSLFFDHGVGLWMQKL
ncbi:unnamed protein product [Zymoseptoria tritici ST99CH_1A5]|nr:unnamed protein product [Zymoseptoria tritici ST99CH_3D7]SMR56161.1 unnamed protein product [Zymoseptoria tritici ST99CH_3D1]SMY25344.1 unnamed protein product [Zymoseptoria tritici ST99CH_1A5]